MSRTFSVMGVVVSTAPDAAPALAAGAVVALLEHSEATSSTAVAVTRSRRAIPRGATSDRIIVLPPWTHLAAGTTLSRDARGPPANGLHATRGAASAALRGSADGDSSIRGLDGPPQSTAAARLLPTARVRLARPSSHSLDHRRGGVA